MSLSPIVIYHNNCHDGITAFWCAKQKYPEAEGYPGIYQVPPDLERLRGRDVIIVDFSYKRPELVRVKEVAASLLVIDHHESAQRELEGLPYCIFDMNRSGAGLAWDLLVGGTRPLLVDYIEDRDLFRFALPNSREVHAALSQFSLDYETRRVLMSRPVESLVVEGRVILRYHDKLVDTAAKAALPMLICDHLIPSVCCPNVEIMSDLGHKLAQRAPFALMWTEFSDGVCIASLRADGNGIKVNDIAVKFGGGGHPNAAGFRTTRDFIRDALDKGRIIANNITKGKPLTLDVFETAMLALKDAASPS
jgi:oligoribonuclease NrnB/cAMP/cGMP phosphodiesterase (DHH superfamily)